jgi:hypothetical protein
MKSSSSRAAVEIRQPDSPEMPDKGPRLVDLDEKTGDSRIEHYIRLADIALRNATQPSKP